MELKGFALKLQVAADDLVYPFSGKLTTWGMWMEWMCYGFSRCLQQLQAKQANPWDKYGRRGTYVPSEHGKKRVFPLWVTLILCSNPAIFKIGWQKGCEIISKCCDHIMMIWYVKMDGVLAMRFCSWQTEFSAGIPIVSAGQWQLHPSDDRISMNSMHMVACLNCCHMLLT